MRIEHQFEYFTSALAPSTAPLPEYRRRRSPRSHSGAANSGHQSTHPAT